MTAAGWIQIVVFVARPDRADAARRRLHGARLHRRAGRRSTASSAGSSARSTALLGTSPDREQDWRGYARSVLAVQRRRLRRALPDPAHAGHPPVRTRRTSAPARGTSRSTPPRRSSRTRTGSSTAARRRCRTSRRWPGLAVQNFLSAAVGIAVCIAVIRGFARRSTRPPRQLLGRRHADAALRAAADLRSSARCSSSRRA